MDDRAASRRRIREEIRARRAGLDTGEQAAASMAVLTRLAGLSVFDDASVVAGYRAVRGELDVGAALTLMVERGVDVTLPRVVGEHLEFVRGDLDDGAVGSFGIVEPTGDDIVPIARHDVMLVPLVAFDAVGNRLGQGGGYYDRAGADRGERPVLVGIAHAFQQVDDVPVESWDVSLDAVITDDAVLEIRPGALGT